MSQDATRRDFSSKEDFLLVKYLAKNNPTAAGRNGNLIYKSLVDNVEKYPWAAEHPWQSWRNRFVKNGEDFNLRIARYQKKHNINREGEDIFHTLSKMAAKRRRKNEGIKKVKSRQTNKATNEGDESREKGTLEEESDEGSTSDREKGCSPKEVEKPEATEQTEEASVQVHDGDNEEPMPNETREEGELPPTEVSSMVDDRVERNNEDEQNALSGSADTSEFVLDDEAEVDQLLDSVAVGDEDAHQQVVVHDRERDSANVDQKVSDQPLTDLNLHSTGLSAPGKRKRVISQSDDSQYFESLLGSPHPSIQSSLLLSNPTRQLPRLIEGPFSTVFAESLRGEVNGSGAIDSDIEDENGDDRETPQGTEEQVKGWPPRRNRVVHARDMNQQENDVLSENPNKKEQQVHSQDFDERGSKRRKTSPSTQISQTETFAESTPPSTAAVLATSPSKRHQQHPLSLLLPSTESFSSQLSCSVEPGLPSSRVALHLFSQPSQIPGNSGGYSENSGTESLLKSLVSRFSRNTGLQLRQQQNVPDGAVRASSHFDPTTNELSRSSLPTKTPDRATIYEDVVLPNHSSASIRERKRHSNPDVTATTLTPQNIAGHTSPGKKSTASHEHDAMKFPTPSASPVDSTSDPFINVLPSSSRHADKRPDFIVKSRRQTFGGSATGPMDAEVDRVDRSNLARQVTRHSLPGNIMVDDGDRSRTLFETTPLAPNARGKKLPSQGLSAADQKLIYGEGLKSLIKRMSQNHGFQEDVTWRLWKALGNLRLVDLALKGMRHAAERAALDIVEMTDDRQKRQAETSDHRDADHDSSPSPQRSSHVRSPRHTSGKAQSLTPVATNNVREPEYFPPQASRAGRFSRLVEQGRLKEALKREERRASHGDASAHKGKRLQKLLFPNQSVIHEPEKPVPASVSRGVVTKESSRNEGGQPRGSKIV